MTIFFLAVGAFVLGCVVWGFTKCEKPFLTALKSAITGVGSLLLVNLVSGFTGCYIAVNYYTAFIATVLSLPGVCALLIMRLLFHY